MDTSSGATSKARDAGPTECRIRLSARQGSDQTFRMVPTGDFAGKRKRRTTTPGSGTGVCDPGKIRSRPGRLSAGSEVGSEAARNPFGYGANPASIEEVR